MADPRGTPIVLDVRPHIILYVDERRPEGKEALEILKDVDEYVVRIPVDGGLPRAVVGRATYNGRDELRRLAAELA